MDLITLTNKDGIIMDSRDIAELTDKKHSHVCRDIRVQLEEQNIDVSTYGSIYLDSYGREQTCYRLDKFQISLLITGYSIPLRAKVLRRLEELEVKNAKIKPPTQLQLAEQVVELLKQREIDKPKIEFYEAVTDSKDAIDMGYVAKVINMGIGRNELFELLRNTKILMKNNIPYQKYIDCEYFRVIESRFNKPNGDVGINLKTIVYQKGVDFIISLVKEK